MIDEELISESDELYEHHRITVDPGQGSLRIDKYLAGRLSHVSRNKIQNAAASDCILVNKVPVKNNYKIKPGDVISVVLPMPPKDTEVKAENIPVDIFYEDSSLIVVNKKAGMVVHPAYGNYTGTLVNALLYHYEQLPGNPDIENRAGLVHRLDKDTSGLLVVAKTDYALNFLAKQFFDHSIKRTYVALLWGDLKTNEGKIETNLARDPRDRRKVRPFDLEGTGKNAVTHYKVIERFGYQTLVECRLETGRTHQIRAHMKYIGHPVFNDETYGGAEILAGPSFTKYKQFIINCFKLIPRQALHAKSLGFIHPETKEDVFFDSELPEDFSAVLEKLSKYSANKLIVDNE